MKKLITVALTLAAGVAFVHAQGTVILQQLTTGLVYTNTGSASGQIVQPGGSYDYELLDMTSAAWNALTGSQQQQADSLLANPSDISLWTDSGVSGTTSNIGAGAKSGISGGNGVAAANWTAPSGATYSTGATDYYQIVGWSVNLGTSWATVSGEITGNSIPTSPNNEFFGETAVAFDQAGGGPNSLGAPTLFGASPNGATGLAGSGGLGTGPDALTLFAVPEPTTLALSGIGGLSMLFLRRRKS